MHPLVFEQAKAQLQRLHTKVYVIVIVPLLAESPAFQQLVQRILVVDSNEKSQIARVIERNRMTVAEVNAIIAHQTSRAARLQIADDVIHNESSLGKLVEQVSVLHQRYLRQNNIGR